MSDVPPQQAKQLDLLDFSIDELLDEIRHRSMACVCAVIMIRDSRDEWHYSIRGSRGMLIGMIATTAAHIDARAEQLRGRSDKPSTEKEMQDAQ